MDLWESWGSREFEKDLLDCLRHRRALPFSIAYKGCYSCKILKSTILAPVFCFYFRLYFCKYWIWYFFMRMTSFYTYIMHIKLTNLEASKAVCAFIYYFTSHIYHLLHTQFSTWWRKSISIYCSLSWCIYVGTDDCYENIHLLVNWVVKIRLN